MTSIWAFCVLFFVLYEAIYPADHDFIFFFSFKNNFYQRFQESWENPDNLFVHINNG